MEPSTFEVTLYCKIAGPIWMPATTAFKDVKLTDSKSPFSDFRYSDGSRPTLRDMVLKATNDGDFQNAALVEGSIKVRHHRKDRVVEKWIELSPETRTIEDCWADAKTLEDVEEIMAQYQD
jgi:hypothetical protein